MHLKTEEGKTISDNQKPQLKRPCSDREKREPTLFFLPKRSHESSPYQGHMKVQLIKAKMGSPYQGHMRAQLIKAT